MGQDTYSAEIAPMVNGGLMQRYIGKKVRCVVKIGERNHSGEIMAQTSDGQTIKIIGEPRSYSSKFVEIFGIVDMSGVAIKEQTAIDFGDNFDFESYDKLCLLANNDARSLFM